MRKLAIGLISTGAAAVVLSVGLTSFSNIRHKKLISDFELSRQSTIEQNISNLESIKEESEKKKDKITEDMIGLIKIPSIDVNFPIFEGVQDKVLKSAVGHFEESALPGEVGNMTVLGHNNFILVEPFKELDEVSGGDFVVISTLDNDYVYRIETSYFTDPYDKEVVRKTKESILTIITCTDDAELRFVVEAKLVKEEDKSEILKELSKQYGINIKETIVEEAIETK